MGGDYSRSWFDPSRDFAAVLMQQGRVQLDADWNELVTEFLRRMQAGTLDTVGPAVAARDSGAFEVKWDGASLTIGRGRMYVDGLLAENHGLDGQNNGPTDPAWNPREWDPQVAEMRGLPEVPYERQPYYPEPAAWPAADKHLVYLDVWQREVSHVEGAPVEQAVGVDTTGRLQTVWQVKLLRDIDPAVTCATPEKDIPEWEKLVTPAAGRLTTSTADPDPQRDPCHVPPSGGYRGLENQLYRVEIHTPGPLGTATFKWSRDNASLKSRVLEIPSRSQIVVDRLGRDDYQRFTDGDWVEVTDDSLELKNLPGELRRIIVGGVDDATRTITLDAPLSNALFAVDGQNRPNPARHTRVLRWDQTGSTDSIRVPPNEATKVALEDGISVSFALDPAILGGEFRAGDYWIFAARTADASVELLNRAPPRGIHHHYARLAIWAPPNAPTDCRVEWPPEAGCGECTVCVSEDTHKNGVLTIQQAIDRVREVGGTICLGPGTYRLEGPLDVADATSVRLVGQAWRTVLISTTPGPAIRLDKSTGVTLEKLVILAVAAPDEHASGAVTVQNCASVSLDRCALLSIAVPTGTTHAVASTPAGTAVFLSDVAALIEVTRCLILAGRGVAGPQTDKLGYLLTARLTVRDNLMLCTNVGVSFRGPTLHFLETRLTGNTLVLCRQEGIAALGATLEDSTVNIVGNDIRTTGSGIAVASARARVSENDITALPGSEGAGILLTSGFSSATLEKCQVIGNRVVGVQGPGIAISVPVNSLLIKRNVVDGAGRGGIVMLHNATATRLVIENNQLLRIGLEANSRNQAVGGVRIINTTDVALAGNIIDMVGPVSIQSPLRYGVQLLACTAARIAGNRIVGLGPPKFMDEAIGIDILGPFETIDVVDNTVQRRAEADAALGEGSWLALRVRTKLGQTPERLDSDLMVGLLGNILVVFTETGFAWFPLHPTKTETVAVRGNVLQALASTASAVYIEGPDSCVVTENRCVLSGGRDQPVILVEDAHLIASNNRLRGPAGRPALRALRGKVTVLGNVASGEILVGDQMPGHTLGAPWKDLNLTDVP